MQPIITTNIKRT